MIKKNGGTDIMQNNCCDGEKECKKIKDEFSRYGREILDKVRAYGEQKAKKLAEEALEQGKRKVDDFLGKQLKGVDNNETEQNREETRTENSDMNNEQIECKNKKIDLYTCEKRLAELLEENMKRVNQEDDGDANWDEVINILGIKDVIIEKDGQISVDIESKEAMIKLMVYAIMGAMELTFQEISLISREFHNDRKSKLYTAENACKRAQLDQKSGQHYAYELINAYNLCFEAMEAIKHEIILKLNYFSKYPKKLILKVPYALKYKEFAENAELVLEDFLLYYKGLMLKLKIDLYTGRMNSLICQVSEEMEFLKKITKSEGYERIVELDEDNKAIWVEYKDEVLLALNSVNLCEEYIKQERICD